MTEENDQSCFCWGILFTSRGRLQDLHWINCLAAFQLVIFFTFYLLLFHTNLCSSFLRYSLAFLGSSYSSSVPLAAKAPFASCVCFQRVEERSSSMSYQQLISPRAIFISVWLFLRKKRGENTNWLMITKLWLHGSCWQLLSNEKNYLAYVKIQV